MRPGSLQKPRSVPPGGQCLGAGDRERVGLPAPLTTAPQASPPRPRKGWTAPWGGGGVQEPEQEGRGSGSDSGTEPSDRNPNTISPPHAYSPFCLLVKKKKQKKAKNRSSGKSHIPAPGRAPPQAELRPAWLPGSPRSRLWPVAASLSRKVCFLLFSSRNGVKRPIRVCRTGNAEPDFGTADLCHDPCHSAHGPRRREPEKTRVHVF